MAKVTGGVKNAAEMRRKLAKVSGIFVDTVAAALYTETEIEATEVKRRTPVDTGVLRSTVIAEGPERKGNTLSTTISVGGPAAPYAVPVHENLDAWHPVGQAKFLESTLRESAPYIAERVAKRAKLRGKV